MDGMTEQNLLSQDFTVASLLSFTLPTILMMMFMGLYTIVDTIFVSQFVNTNALAALNIVCPLINLTIGFSSMLAVGGNASIAHNVGHGNLQETKENFTLLLLVGLANILFDYIFIALLNIGIAGAALGTRIRNLIPTIVGILFFAKIKDILPIVTPKWDLLWF